MWMNGDQSLTGIRHIENLKIAVGRLVGWSRRPLLHRWKDKCQDLWPNRMTEEAQSEIGCPGPELEPGNNQGSGDPWPQSSLQLGASRRSEWRQYYPRYTERANISKKTLM